MNSILNSLHTLCNEVTDSPFTETQKNILRQMRKDLLQDKIIKRKIGSILILSETKEEKQEKLRDLISYIQSKSSSSSSISVSNQSQIIEQSEQYFSSLNISLQQEKEKSTIIRRNMEIDINNSIKGIEENLDNNNKNIVKEHLSKLTYKIGILFKENLEMYHLLEMIIEEKNTRYDFLMDYIQKKEEREKELMNEMNSINVKMDNYQNAINDLQNQLDEKGRIIENLQNQLDEKGRIIEEKCKEQSVLIGKINDLQNQLEEKNKEQNSLKETVRQLKSQLTKYPEMSRQLKGKEKTIQELRQTISSMNDEIKTLKGDILKLENTIKSNQKAHEKDIAYLKMNYSHYEEYKEQYDFCLIRKFLSYCIDKIDKTIKDRPKDEETMKEYRKTLFTIRKIACKKIHFEPYLPFHSTSKDNTFTFFCKLINNTNIKDINYNRIYLPNNCDTFLKELFNKTDTDFMDKIDITFNN